MPIAYNPSQHQIMTDSASVANIFDIKDIGHELSRELRDGLLDQRLVLHCLTSLHDAIPVVSGW